MSCRILLTLFLAACSTLPQSVRDLKYERSAPSASPLPDGRTRWAVVIGVSTYQYVPPDFQLRFAHRDAEDFARFLRSSEGGGLPAANIRLLTESGATLASVRSALQTWLPRVAGPDDIVYLFFAGHGVLAQDKRAYFVTQDSDPQNLHATALAFDEVDGVLSRQLRSRLVILMADACHAGSIGWTRTSTLGLAQPALEKIGSADRSFLKLLAARPTEQSFEDERWDGGHGVFTHALLTGLRGAAERDKDGIIRASELIDYIAKYVPEQTSSRQNPRVAGNFEGALALAKLSPAKVAASRPANLRITGIPGTAVYVNAIFRGTVRQSGELLVENVPGGVLRLSVDLPGESSFEYTVQVPGGSATVDLNKSPGLAVMRIQSLAKRGAILSRGGAIELLKSQSLPPPDQAAAEAAITAGLEGIGQNCVNDYVQSTSTGLKRSMLVEAVEAYNVLRTMRPGDRSLEMKQKFCLGRLRIAEGRFPEAVAALQGSLAVDPSFACAHNALGVAFLRLGQTKEARASFELAARHAPEWSLPMLQVGQMMMANAEPRKAAEFFEHAVRFQPGSIVNRWHLLRAYRLGSQFKEFESQLPHALALDPNYPPVYLESGLFYKARNDPARAVQAMDTYLLLAPNYADSSQVQDTANELRKSLGTK